MEKRKWSFEKILCLIGYLMVPIFFVVLYFLMTKSIEDINQGVTTTGVGIAETLDRVYHTLPRLGEFYTWVASKYMTMQLSSGLDVLFRLGTATIASGVIYFATMFICGRRPKLQYKDVVIYLGIWLLLMILPCSEAFMYRFNYVNNYGVALLVSLWVALLFRLNVWDGKWWQIVGSVLLGFMFAIASEMMPVVFLIILFVWVGIKLFKKELTVRKIFKEYKIQISLILGIVIGFVFSSVGNSIASRTSGGSLYSVKYDYVALTQLPQDFIGTLYRMFQHVWFNLRYVSFLFVLMLIYVLVEATLFKKGDKKYLLWQTIFLAFGVIFMGGSSLINVEDDLYARFMAPLYMVAILATGLFIWHIFEHVKIPDRIFMGSTLALLVVGLVLVADMSYAFMRYKNQVAPMLDDIGFDAKNGLVVSDENMDGNIYMSPSPIFRLRQASPFAWEPDEMYDDMKYRF